MQVFQIIGRELGGTQETAETIFMSFAYNLIVQFSGNGHLVCHSMMIAALFRRKVEFNGLRTRLPLFGFQGNARRTCVFGF